MNEAKALATEQSEEAKKATKEKMAEMMKVLELPSDWCKQDTVTPEQLLTDLGGIIDQYSSIAEVAESYKNDLDAVSKASGGRALRGIYYSKYALPQTAGRPIILMPSNVTLTNPDDAMKITYLKFQESRAAANYVHTVKSSSTSIGFGVAGFYEGFVGEVKGAYSTEKHRDETRSVKTYSTSASVLQFIWTAKKCFQIEQEQMKLTESAKLMANCISKVSEKDAEKRKARARRFMEMFGSHVPAGVQTLGGVFFSIADAESEGVQKTTTLTKAATEKLQAQMSFGFLGGAFGIGGSVKAEHQGSTGETQAEQEDQKKTSYTYTVHAMGPAATNPVVFQKLLAYNSTWALIDRGPHEAYMPIWELLRSLGGKFELLTLLASAMSSTRATDIHFKNKSNESSRFLLDNEHQDVVPCILGDPGANSGGEGKSKRAEKYCTKKSKERREELLGTMSYQTKLSLLLQHMFSTGQSSPHVDSSQDYHLVMTTEEEGYTILHFERAANTGDAKDILFMANTEYFFVWALHSSFDATESSTVYPFHERKGSSQFTQLIQTG
ncbi:unnamed protein product, partial [Porites evermanni]